MQKNMKRILVFIISFCYIMVLFNSTPKAFITSKPKDSPIFYEIIENFDVPEKGIIGNVEKFKTKFRVDKCTTFRQTISAYEENEKFIKISTYINNNVIYSKKYEIGKKYFDKFNSGWASFDNGEYRFYKMDRQGYYPKKSYSFNDTIKTVVITYDENEQEVNRQETVIGTYKYSIPVGNELKKNVSKYRKLSVSIGLIPWLNSQENKETISKNTKKIEKNEKKIEENKEKIQKNTEAIKDIKEDIKVLKEEVIELETNLSELKVKIKHINDEVAEIKKYILTIEDLNTENLKNVELWYRQVEDAKEDNKQNKKTSFFNFVIEANAAENDWFHIKLDKNSQVAFEEGKNYEVVLVTENKNGEENYTGYDFIATNEELKTEKSSVELPFELFNSTEKIDDYDEMKNDMEQIKVNIQALSSQKQDENKSVYMYINYVAILIIGVLIGYIFRLKKVR